MCADLNERLTGLAGRIAELKDERARVEGQLQTLKAQRETILKSCQEMGVDPAKLDDEIDLREKSLFSSIQDVEQVLIDIERSRDEVIERERDKARVANGGGEGR